MKKRFSTSNDEHMLLFVKYPTPGSVKSRLAASLGDRLAAGLYRCFVRDCLKTLSAVSRSITVCYDPSRKEKIFRAWLGNDYRYLPQRGNDLGERMKHAFEDAFLNGASRALLLGSDIPDVPAEHVSEAVSALRAAGCVVGPACDGGYYCIGFSREFFMPEVFERIPWGTGSVYTETVERLSSSLPSNRIHVLPEWHDIDTYTDLCHYAERNSSVYHRCSETYRYINEKKIVQIEATIHCT